MIEEYNCRTSGCNNIGLPIRIYSNITLKRIIYRCGDIAFCAACLVKYSSKHPELEYRIDFGDKYHLKQQFLQYNPHLDKKELHQLFLMFSYDELYKIFLDEDLFNNLSKNNRGE